MARGDDLAKAANGLGSPCLVQEFARDAPTISYAGVIVERRLLGFVTASRPPLSCLLSRDRAAARAVDRIERLVTPLR